MAYCDLDDIRGRLPKWLVITNDSQPTTEEAEEIIEGIAEEMDSVLAATYDLPITAKKALRLLQRYNTLGAAAEIWYAAVQGQEAGETAATWREDYQSFLTRLRNGSAVLPGVSDDDAGDSPRKPYFEAL